MSAAAFSSKVCGVEIGIRALSLTVKPGDAAQTPPLSPRMAAWEMDFVPRSWLSMYPCQDMAASGYARVEKGEQKERSFE